jgi:RNA polymerase sigma factor (sigma-70 family)
VSDNERDHDDDWLTGLFGQHSGAVLAYARRRVDTAEDAEDVVVEVFATAWRRRDSVPDEAALPWLYATAANVIAHVIRSEGRRTRLGARLASVRPLREPADPADGIVEALAAQDTVAAALDDLAESDAELLRLWAWEQLEPTEIAAVLGCSTGTARTRMHRARGRLREALTRRGVTGTAIDGAVIEPRGERSSPGSAATPERADPGAPAADPGGAGSPTTPPTGSEAAR